MKGRLSNACLLMMACFMFSSNASGFKHRSLHFAPVTCCSKSCTHHSFVPRNSVIQHDDLKITHKEAVPQQVIGIATLWGQKRLCNLKCQI